MTHKLTHQLLKSLTDGLPACLMAVFLLSPAAQAEIVIYTYDEAGSANGIGRLTSVSDASGTTEFNYDEVGRVTQTDKTVDGTPYTTHTTYDVIGRVASVGYPDDTTVNYAYNGPLLQRVYEGAVDHVQYAGYNALGQSATATFGNGVVTHYTYSNSGNPTCPEHNFRLCTLITALDTNTYQNLRYSYDNAGNMTSITNPINGNESFVPDDLDRLTSAAGPYGTINYTYDEIGNMTTNSQVGSYTYPTNNIRPHAVSTAGANSYTYDVNGNMESGAGRNITYDTENRPTSMTSGGTTVTLVYDGDGGRVKKTVSGTTTVYIGKLYECTGGVCTKHIFAGSQQIAQKTTTGTIHYYHTDHLGSSSVITDANGNQIQSLAYFPFGNTRINSGSVDVHYKYTGQELDNETGLYFYNARYYDPMLGRFVSADTIVPDPGDPQSLNRYSYVRNNPLLYIDPSGHSWLSEFLHDTEEFFREDIGGMLITQTFMPALGTYYLSQSEAGRNILAAEIGIGTAVATWYCGGCGAAPVLQGALAGEAIGGYSVGRAGGDILSGVVTGGLIGGTISGAFWGAGVLTEGMNPFIQIGAKGVVGGTASELLGGSFEKGFLFAAAAAGAYWAYTDALGYGPNPLPGENNLPNGYYNPVLNGGIPPVESNVWGFNVPNGGGLLHQGGTVSNVANLIVGQNATAHLHDYWLNAEVFTSNVGSMVPAAIVSYGALMSVPFSPILIEQAVGDSRGF